VLNLSEENHPYDAWVYNTGLKDIFLILMILIPGISRLRYFINDFFQKLLFFTHRFFRRAIFEGAKKAMDNSDVGAYLFPEGPVALEIGFTTASTVDRVLRIPGVERLDGLTVRYEGQNYLEAFKAFNTMADLIELVNFI